MFYGQFTPNCSVILRFRLELQKKKKTEKKSMSVRKKVRKSTTTKLPDSLSRQNSQNMQKLSVELSDLRPVLYTSQPPIAKIEISKMRERWARKSAKEQFDGQFLMSADKRGVNQQQVRLQSRAWKY